MGSVLGDEQLCAASLTVHSMMRWGRVMLVSHCLSCVAESLLYCTHLRQCASGPRASLDQ